MRRILRSVFVALLAGIGIGLVYSWAIFPRRINDAAPSALRADFKDQYRSVIAAAYAANGSLPRAEARLSLLEDPDSVEALNAQAQRMLGNSQSLERADLVAALASAIEKNVSGAPISTPTVAVMISAGETFTPIPPLSSPDASVLLTESLPAVEFEPTIIETQATRIDPTPRPTSTFTPEPGDPFTLTGQETICDPNQPEGLLQVFVLNRGRRQLAGIEILITWEGGEERFFTGLKPELGNGYADFMMIPEEIYTVQLARGSEVALDIRAPNCQDAGESRLGGIKLTFQQP